MKHIIASTLLLLSTPVFADLSEGWKAYQTGEYITALNTAKNSSSKEALALACLAGVAQGGTIDTGSQAVKTLHQAIFDCTEAFKVDQNNYEITTALSAVLSFEGKRKQATGHAKLALHLLGDTLTRFPEKPDSYGAYATWHSEVSAAGFFARVALGAKRDTARDMFTNGLSRGDFDIGLQLEYVKFLARGKKKEKAEAIIQADKLLAAEQTSPLDTYFISIGKGLRESLQKNDKKSLKKRLKLASMFRDIENQKSEDTYEIDPWLKTYIEGLKK